MKRYFVIITIISIIYGCNNQKQPPVERPDVPPTFQGTVGSYCELIGYYSVRVHGYSLVMGLPQTGSSECPPAIKPYLVKHIRSLRDGGYLPSNFKNLTADQIINSRNTAMVEVINLQPQSDGGEVTLVETTADHQRCYLEGEWGEPGEVFVVEKRLLIHYHEEPKNEK